jgi:hypothetical protein
LKKKPINTNVNDTSTSASGIESPLKTEESQKSEKRIKGMSFDGYEKRRFTFRKQDSSVCSYITQAPLKL